MFIISIAANSQLNLSGIGITVTDGEPTDEKIIIIKIQADI